MADLAGKQPLCGTIKVHVRVLRVRTLTCSLIPFPFFPFCESSQSSQRTRRVNVQHVVHILHRTPYKDSLDYLIT